GRLPTKHPAAYHFVRLYERDKLRGVRRFGRPRPSASTGVECDRMLACRRELGGSRSRVRSSPARAAGAERSRRLTPDLTRRTRTRRRPTPESPRSAWTAKAWMEATRNGHMR